VWRRAAKLKMLSVMPHSALSPHVRAVVPYAGGELEQIQFLLLDVSVETTERYLGCGSIAKTAFETNTMFYDFHQVPYFKAFHNIMPS
jgi:hypothetical protein